MKKQTPIFAALLLLFLTSGIASAAPQVSSLALSNGVAFSTDFIYESASVRVSGPDGFVYEARIVEGDDLSFAFDRHLADGAYKWQLLVVEPVSAEIRGAMVEARRLGQKDLARQFDVASHTFTGTFRVEGGAVLTPSPGSQLDDRDIATKDIVQLDDVIINGGSLCVGQDCINGESFGSDTIRLKENNLRIHFDDSSNSASFPQNDWRILINDTENGGTNHFSVEDSTSGRSPFRVEAGASANALVVEADSDIGIGTLNPVVELHVVDGDSPTLRLEQDGSSGFTPQTFDLVSNEANFFIRDVTNGSQLPFRIKPGADSDTLFLDADNDVGIQTDSPKAPLHVRAGGSSHTPSNSSVVGFFQNNASTGDGAIMGLLAGDTGNAQFWFGDSIDDNAGRVIYRNNQDALSLWTNGTEQLYIESDGDICFNCNDTQGDAIRHDNGAHLTAGGVWTSVSSRERKQDIESLGLEDAMATLAGLEPVSYRYKRELDETYVGFIAEDVPDLVATVDRKSLVAMDIVAVLTKVVQEQQKAMETQQGTIDALAARLEAIENVD